MSRINFQQDSQGKSKLSDFIYYQDATITVTNTTINVGYPYNQTYNLRAIVGTEHGKNSSGYIGKMMWIILGVFGLLYGITGITHDAPVLGITVLAGSLAVLWKNIQMLDRPYVELKFAGMNNQTLFMKRMSDAEHLAASINLALADMHQPPNPGQSASHPPVFPNQPVSGLN